MNFCIGMQSITVKENFLIHALWLGTKPTYKRILIFKIDLKFFCSIWSYIFNEFLAFTRPHQVPQTNNYIFIIISAVICTQ